MKEIFNIADTMFGNMTWERKVLFPTHSAHS